MRLIRPWFKHLASLGWRILITLGSCSAGRVCRYILARFRNTIRYELPAAARTASILVVIVTALATCALSLVTDPGQWVIGIVAGWCAGNTGIFQACAWAAANPGWVAAGLFLAAPVILPLTWLLIKSLLYGLLLLATLLATLWNLVSILIREIQDNWQTINCFYQTLSPRVDAAVLHRIFRLSLVSGIWELRQPIAGRRNRRSLLPDGACLPPYLPRRHWFDVTTQDLRTAGLAILFINTLADTELSGLLLAQLASEKSTGHPSKALALAGQFATLTADNLGKILEVIRRLDAARGSSFLTSILGAAQNLDESAHIIYVVALCLAPVGVCEAALAQRQL